MGVKAKNKSGKLPSYTALLCVCGGFLYWPAICVVRVVCDVYYSATVSYYSMYYQQTPLYSRAICTTVPST